MLVLKIAALLWRFVLWYLVLSVASMVALGILLVRHLTSKE